MKLQCTYHIWLCSKATDKVLVEKQEEIEKLTREKEGELYSTVSSTYCIWLCSIATDKVLVEKQEEIEKLTREKEGKL